MKVLSRYLSYFFLVTVAFDTRYCVAANAIQPQDISVKSSEKIPDDEKNNYSPSSINRESANHKLTSGQLNKKQLSYPILKVQKFVFVGNSEISSKELQNLVSPFVGQKVSVADLHRIKMQVSKHYVSKGFINSGALLSRISIDSGAVRFKIIEGVLSNVFLENKTKLKENYITKRVFKGNQTALNVKNIDKNLKELRNNRNIDNLHARLVPGGKLGESSLTLKILEKNRNSINIDISNMSSPGVGEEHVSASYQNSNLFGGSEQLIIQSAKTEGADQYVFAYSSPLSSNDIILSLQHSQSDAEIIEEPFNDLDIISQSNLSTLGIEIPVRKALNSSQSLGVEFYHRKSSTELVGTAFSFSPGFVDGKARVSALSLIHNYRSNHHDVSFGIRTNLTAGIDALDSSINSKQPDSRFTRLVNQFIVVKNIRKYKLQWVINGSLQISDDRLLSMEQVALGGSRTVRGYRENLIVGDQGVFISSEIRHRTFNIGDIFWLAAFFDYGRIDNKNFKTPDQNEIASIGLSIVNEWKNRLKLNVSQGFKKSKVSNIGDSLQADGLHFKMGLEFSF